jgi:hypothetical protein
MAGNADAAARLAVAQQCDSLLSRPNISTFDESLGAADYARWRRDLLDMAASIHIAFKATLLTQQNFALGAPTPASMTSHTPTGRDPQGNRPEGATRKGTPLTPRFPRAPARPARERLPLLVRCCRSNTAADAPHKLQKRLVGLLASRRHFMVTEVG